MKKILALVLALVMLVTPFALTSCGPHKKSMVRPSHYMVTYTFVNGYGEEFTITIGENNEDYEDDYFYFSDGEIEVIEKAPHGGGFSTYWVKDNRMGSSAQFVQYDNDSFRDVSPALYGIRLQHFGAYTGQDNVFSNGGVDWRTAGTLEEIEYTEELEGYEQGLLGGREVSFYSFDSAYNKRGNAKIALDNEYALVMFFCLTTPPELLNKENHLENDRYKAYNGPISMLLCTNCLLDDAAPIIMNMIP